MSVSCCLFPVPLRFSADANDVCGLLCINDEEKSGVVLGYFLCISQLSSQKARGLSFHLFIPCFLSPD